MQPIAAADEPPALAETRAWVELAVVGLKLCPFAPGPWADGRIRYCLCDATEPEPLLHLLADEMDRLAATDPADIETTLIVHPQVLTDFLDFNDFLDLADELLEARGHAGVLQVASFHPDYRFADSEPDDPSNATNRSPHPTLHLLREASIERAVDAWGDTASIYEANIRTLEALGPDGWLALQARFQATPPRG